MKPTHFKLNGREKEAAPYHYRECGLDNIYLANGFTREIVDGEEFLTVENVDGLWKAICFSLLSLTRPLEPKELRFLRHHVELTQVELAQYLRVDAQTVARWEKGKTEVSGPADVALRMLVLGAPVMQPEGNEILSKVAQFVESITGQDSENDRHEVFTRTDDRWSHARAA